MRLRLLIEQYLHYRRSLGWRAAPGGGYLGGFGRFVGADVDIADVRPDRVAAFLAGRSGRVTSTWHTKHTILRSFYRWAVTRGHAAASPLPVAVPKRPPRFVPYVYSHDELRRLLRAADAVRRRADRFLEPVTMRTVLLLLYGAGLRVQEALSLGLDDVDLDGRVLTVRGTKFGKTRLVPVGPDLGRALAAYAGVRAAGTAAAAPFLTTRHGKPIAKQVVQDYFRILCRAAGVRRDDGACHQPRLHDLRHTFAVHRLTSWYREGADVQRLLPHLSTYLGHVDVNATQVYLTMTPALLDEARRRFERYAAGGGSHE